MSDIAAGPILGVVNTALCEDGICTIPARGVDPLGADVDPPGASADKRDRRGEPTGRLLNPGLAQTYATQDRH